MTISDGNFINGEWITGAGEAFVSVNPANAEICGRYAMVDSAQIDNAVSAAQDAFYNWGKLSYNSRLNYLKQYQSVLQKHAEDLTICLAMETGKPYWEASFEISGMQNKLEIAQEAYQARTGQHTTQFQEDVCVLEHKPIGVLAVFGPYNFPGHIPNGQIIPALLAGNTVVFKPSEWTPWFSQKMMQCWEEAGLPPGVLNCVQGDGKVGHMLASHSGLNGVLFTGSAKTGIAIQTLFAAHPEKILALELGGNNPLIVDEIDNIQAAVYNVLQSGYITAGQRCTCARRLILVENNKTGEFISQLQKAASKLVIGEYTQRPEPFMGPLIGASAAKKVCSAVDVLLKQGAENLLAINQLDEKLGFVTPGLIDVTSVENRADEEIFGPVLQIIRVPHFEAAIIEANHTRYGLTAGLISERQEKFKLFYSNVKAGLLYWNRPTTGANSKVPFGGVGISGNYRPSAYYSADYCAYPVASLQRETLALPDVLLPGVTLK